MESSKDKVAGLFTESQRRFIKKLFDEGEVDVNQAARELGVSRATIYNHYHFLKSLDFERSRGKIRLQRRGQGVPDAFSERQFRSHLLKDKLAAYVVQNLIAPNDVIFLDSGSTTLYIAEHIREQEIRDLTVVTTNPYVLERLLNYPGLRELSVIGGILERDFGGFYGPWVETLLAGIGYRFQKSFISADGVSVSDNEGIITLSSLVQLSQKKAIMAKSSQVYIVLDESKIGGGGEVLLHYPADWNPSMKLILSSEDPNSDDINRVLEIFRQYVSVLARKD